MRRSFLRSVTTGASPSLSASPTCTAATGLRPIVTKDGVPSPSKLSDAITLRRVNLPAIQNLSNCDHALSGWLVYDFRGSNAVFAQLLPGKRNTTRRAFLFIPADRRAAT